ncbi:MAG: YfhO family protein [Nitrospiria bacterium]
MGKKKKHTQSHKQDQAQRQKQTDSAVIDYLHQHPNTLPLAVLFALLLIFFNEVMFGGKSFLPPDSLTSQSVQPFIRDALSRGIYPRWNPYIFSGMPSFASLQSAPYIDVLGNVINGVCWTLAKIFPLSSFTRILINYFLLGLFAYILLMKKTGVRIVALFAALALVFQPQIISFTAFGHNTKIATAVFIPVIYLLLDEFLENRKLHYFALLALAVGLQLLRAHTQIAYYTFMMIGLIILFWGVESLIKKRPPALLLKSLAGALLAVALGVAMSSWLYLSVQEYAQYSIRGGTTGLNYGYATSWSFSPAEMMTFIVPSFMGFGGQTYWGTMPFTDYPLYPGIVTLMFAGLAIVIKRDRTVVFFTILALASLVVSFGKNLPILYDPLFKLLPFFNKFRVPSMIHVLLAFAVATLAGFGLHSLLNLKEKSSQTNIRRYIFGFAGVCGVVAVVLLIGKGFYLGLVAGSAKPLSDVALQAAYEKVSIDALKLLAIVGAAAFLILSYLQGKIKGQTVGVALTCLLVVDLWLVDFKLNNPQLNAGKQNYFAENEVIKLLKQDKSPFRIFSVYDEKPDTWYAYHKIQNIKGYHAAKLKIYQTFLEKTQLDARNIYNMPPFLGKYLNVVHKDGQPSLSAVAPEDIPPANLHADYAILDMLNVKYLVSLYPIPDPRFKPLLRSRPYVFENTEVLPRAFFVDEVQVVENGEDFFDLLLSGKFEPAQTAVLEEPPDFEIEPGVENRVEVTSYDIHEIKLKAHAEKPALMVLSEIYYPAGWKAYVDGSETKIYKTDYILRSIFLEPGDHEIKFVFDPKMFTLGVWLTFGILFCLLGLLVFSWKMNRAKAQSRSD